MNKQELIKKIALVIDGALDNWSRLEGADEAEYVAQALYAEGWLRNPGEPIEPEDIRYGDRIRIVRPNGEVHERVTAGGVINHGYDYYLLDRPKPELPTEVGSVVMNGAGTCYTLDKEGLWRNGRFTFLARHFDGVDWEVVV